MVGRMGADGRDRTGPGQRALAAIVLCAALPVLIGMLLTTGPGPAARLAGHPGGHWVYVPDRGVAVHVDGDTKRVDATVAVGSAGTGSPVLQDRQSAYLIDDDQVLVFGRGGPTGDFPSAGVAERPVTVEARGAAYLVYRLAGVVVRLGPKPKTIEVGGFLGVPVVTPTGQLWTYRMNSGELCVLTPKLTCPGRVPAGHTGSLAVLDGKPGFVDLTAGTWQEIGGRPVALGVSLPANAIVGATDVGGRLPVIDPSGPRLLLVGTHGDVITVPLDAGRYGAPVSTGRAVAVVNAGTITSYDARGKRKAALTVPGGAIRLATGADGRVYADSPDGRQSVVMDSDGTLTSVPTTGDPPSSDESPGPAPSLPPATVVVTTTETVPPSTEETPTTTSTPPSSSAPPPATTDPSPPATSEPPPSSPEKPTVDVLSASASGPEQATVQLRVSGTNPVFCHVYFNSVERAATKCANTMTVVANGLSPGTTYDIYVLGTNAAGTGIPGKRVVLRM